MPHKNSENLDSNVYRILEISGDEEEDWFHSDEDIFKNESDDPDHDPV